MKRKSLKFVTRACSLTALVMLTTAAFGAGGSLTLKVQEESDQSPTITRLEIWRGVPGGKVVPIRRTVPAGVGVVLDRQTELLLADSVYAFRMIRGPEYRIVSGTFSLEDTSLDEHSVQLPRMINMLSIGWTSGDCCVVASPNNLPIRMASEDLHMATTLGESLAKPIPHRDADEPIANAPSWIQTNASHSEGLVFYGNWTPKTESTLPVQQLVEAKKNDTRVAIENPFAWPLPVWLASQKADGIFVFGDWLRLDRKILSAKNGRGPEVSLGGGQAMGRWAEEIYRNILDAGLRLPPLAGGGSNSANTPVGYNRLYVGRPLSEYEKQDSKLDAGRVTSPEAWWNEAWQGHSVATNGPLLRPTLGGQIPGHVFKASNGETLTLRPELSLSVRDPVEYLEVIHNNHVHFSARLEDFAKKNGVIPPISIDKSGWVIARVVTLHKDHYRAAVSAPWYIEFDGQPRTSKRSVKFFTNWLSEYEHRLKRLPPKKLKPHVPFVQAARKFWNDRASIAVD